MLSHFGIFKNTYITTFVFVYLAYNQIDNILN